MVPVLVDNFKIRVVQTVLRLIKSNLLIVSSHSTHLHSIPAITKQCRTIPHVPTASVESIGST